MEGLLQAVRDDEWFETSRHTSWVQRGVAMFARISKVYPGEEQGEVGGPVDPPDPSPDRS
jgi:hypothetical protein